MFFCVYISDEGNQNKTPSLNSQSATQVTDQGQESNENEAAGLKQQSFAQQPNISFAMPSYSDFARRRYLDTAGPPAPTPEIVPPPPPPGFNPFEGFQRTPFMPPQAHMYPTLFPHLNPTPPPPAAAPQPRGTVVGPEIRQPRVITQQVYARPQVPVHPSK